MPRSEGLSGELERCASAARFIGDERTAHGAHELGFFVLLTIQDPNRAFGDAAQHRTLGLGA